MFVLKNNRNPAGLLCTMSFSNSKIKRNKNCVRHHGIRRRRWKYPTGAWNFVQT